MEISKDQTRRKSWFGAAVERMRRNRAKAAMRKIMRELLRHDDRLLEDAGFSRAVLSHALTDPDRYGCLNEIRRRSIEVLEGPRARAPSKPALRLVSDRASVAGTVPNGLPRLRPSAAAPGARC